MRLSKGPLLHDNVDELVVLKGVDELDHVRMVCEQLQDLDLSPDVVCCNRQFDLQSTCRRPKCKGRRRKQSIKGPLQDGS